MTYSDIEMEKQTNTQQLIRSATSWPKHHASLGSTFNRSASLHLTLPSPATLEPEKGFRSHLAIGVRPSLQPPCETSGELFTLLVSFSFHLTGWGSGTTDTQQSKVPLHSFSLYFFFLFLNETTSELQWSKLNATFWGWGYFFLYYLFASSGCTLRWKKCIQYKFPIKRLFFFSIFFLFTRVEAESLWRISSSLLNFTAASLETTTQTGVRLITIWWL